MSEQKCGPIADVKLSVPDTATFKPPEGSCGDKANKNVEPKPEFGCAAKCNPQAPPPPPPKPKENDCEKKCKCDDPEKPKETKPAEAAPEKPSSAPEQGKCANDCLNRQKKRDPEESPNKGGREYCACAKPVAPIPTPSVCGCGTGGDLCGPNISCEVKPLKMKKRPVIGKLD